MTIVYLDQARNPYRGMIMCHMISPSICDLFLMAEHIGMQAKWFQPLSFPHFDVSLTRRKIALDPSKTDPCAIEVDRRRLVLEKRNYRAKLEEDEEEARALRELTERPSFDLARRLKRRD